MALAYQQAFQVRSFHYLRLDIALSVLAFLPPESSYSPAFLTKQKKIAARISLRGVSDLCGKAIVTTYGGPY